MLDVLLLQRSGENVFYFEESRASHGLAQWGKARGRLGRIKRVLEKSYRALETKRPLTERLCAHLRHHEGVVLHVPATLSPESAGRLFLSFLAKCVKTHGRWVWADGLLAAFGATLVLIPGPNIFFFYPALRALGHHYAQRGGKKHQRKSDLVVQRCALLDNFPELPVSEMLKRAGEIQSKLGFIYLRKFLERKYGIH
ncbi:MAG: hypothetical protein HY644_03330 [Acidobacteria bacterium]|nr:hypothetical protein [Acidobacteriota bacterium]